MKQTGHSKLTLSYFGQLGGGEVKIMAGDVEVATLNTDLPEPAAVEQTWPIPPEARNFSLRVTRGPVRLFNVTFRKDGPGVVYDSIGLNGTWAGVLAVHINGQHWIEEMRMAKPDLVIINYGTNESGYLNYVETSYPKDVREIIRRIRAASPETAVMLMSPMDRGARQAGGGTGRVMDRSRPDQARLLPATILNSKTRHSIAPL